MYTLLVEIIVSVTLSLQIRMNSFIFAVVIIFFFETWLMPFT